MLPMIAYDMDKATEHSPKGTMTDTFTDEVIPSTYFGPCGGRPHATNMSDYSGYLDEMDAKATKRLYSSLKGTDVQALVSIAEAPKSFELVAGTATSFAKAFRDLKRGDVVGAMRRIGVNDYRKGNRMSKALNREIRHGGNSLVDIAGSRWLELQYGWKPMLNDVQNAIQALDYRWQQSGADFIVSAGASRSFPLTEVACPLAQRNSHEGTGMCAVKYTLYCQVISSGRRNASAIGLTNLASVAWELIPYSFVVDWFSPIGSWIEAQTATAGLQLVDGCKTKFFRCTSSAHINKNRVRAFHDWADADLSYSGTFAEMHRAKLYTWPTAAMMLRPKTISDAMSWTKTLSALALLNSAFKRRR